MRLTGLRSIVRIVFRGGRVTGHCFRRRSAGREDCYCTDGVSDEKCCEYAHVRTDEIVVETADYLARRLEGGKVRNSGAAVHSSMVSLHSHTEKVDSKLGELDSNRG